MEREEVRGLDMEEVRTLEAVWLEMEERESERCELRDLDEDDVRELGGEPDAAGGGMDADAVGS